MYRLDRGRLGSASVDETPGYGVGGTHSSGALGKTSLKGGFLNSSLKTEEATM